jgi:hypothetical protein
MKKTEYKVAPVATFESVDAFCTGSRATYTEHVVEPPKEKDSCSLWTVLCRLFTISSSSTEDRAPNRETFDRAPLHITQNRRTFDRGPDKLK